VAADSARTCASTSTNHRANRFTLTYEEFWDGFRGLAAATRLIATTEPVLAGGSGSMTSRVRAAAGRPSAIAPDGRVMPCTYWPAAVSRSVISSAPARHRGGGEFVDARRTPAACVGCPCAAAVPAPGADWAGRAADPYCPFARGDQIVLDWERAARLDLPKVGALAQP